jgi:hypothetical protein
MNRCTRRIRATRTVFSEPRPRSGDHRMSVLGSPRASSRRFGERGVRLTNKPMNRTALQLTGSPTPASGVIGRCVAIGTGLLTIKHHPFRYTKFAQLYKVCVHRVLLNGSFFRTARATSFKRKQSLMNIGSASIGPRHMACQCLICNGQPDAVRCPVRSHLKVRSITVLKRENAKCRLVL